MCFFSQCHEDNICHMQHEFQNVGDLFFPYSANSAPEVRIHTRTLQRINGLFFNKRENLSFIFQTLDIWVTN